MTKLSARLDADFIKETDQFTLSCEQHGELATSVWSSVFSFIMHGHSKTDGDHEYTLKNEESGFSFNPFTRK